MRQQMQQSQREQNTKQRVSPRGSEGKERDLEEEVKGKRREQDKRRKLQVLSLVSSGWSGQKHGVG